MESDYKFLTQDDIGVYINIKLVPNSAFNKIVDFNEEFLKIKISSPPIENRANKELISFCSDVFSINKSKIKLVSGEKSKIKKILLYDTKIEDVIQIIMFMLNSENKK